MKKIMFLAACGALLLGTSSCKKDYTCNCTVDYTVTSSDPLYQSQAGSVGSASTSISGKMKKKESEEWCKSYEYSETSTYEQSYFKEFDDDFNAVYDDVTFTEKESATCSL